MTFQFNSCQHSLAREVFPTCVGVFLELKTVWISVVRSSPRAWGCFYCAMELFRMETVFPTCVGVFLEVHSLPEGQGRLPHVRGGVSQHIFEMVGQKRSSPRTWGCFPDTQRQFHRSQVFPTHVGCFCQSFYLMKEPITASNGTPHTLLWILPAS